jgi:lactate dehydrogenase-like 2-hydroxyacid dehydrogenase
MTAKLYRKVVILDSVILFPEHRRRLEELAEEVVEYNTCKSEEETLERCRGADCIISCWVDISRRVITENPQLRTVAFWTHDYEHRIDHEFARQRGINVPAIPDYGTDSVAELVLIALLNASWSAGGSPRLSEAIAARLGDEVRLFRQNVKDTLDGRWVHEYIKTGQRRLESPDQIPEETLKGLTVGVVDDATLTADLVRMLASGFRMNVIYSLCDRPHSLDLGFRPIERLASESDVLVYDSRTLPVSCRPLLRQPSYQATIDVASLSPCQPPLTGKTLGIIGMGRIGSRVAQLARQGFGMDVQYFSRTRKRSLEEELGIRASSLADITSSSDVISLHLPHHGADGFVSADLVRQVPNGTMVVNASVGNVIEDERFLMKRFGAGELYGYLDVYRALPPRAELRALQDTLTATYRLGWRTKSTVGLKTHKLLSKLAAVPALRVSMNSQVARVIGWRLARRLPRILVEYALQL